ncbi:unnamed protein product [Pleuronectes platessa]|uniref:Uncharacterized protein n=1 Tax=Pleuronectes platessa TaxID=8262 RepID=A0A9N7VZY0_PLEPL|nr:unnamed protein product [Pleuronectes platessa]
MRPGIVLHQEEPGARVRSGNRSEDFIPGTGHRALMESVSDSLDRDMHTSGLLEELDYLCNLIGAAADDDKEACSPSCDEIKQCSITLIESEQNRKSWRRARRTVAQTTQWM